MPDETVVSLVGMADERCGAELPTHLAHVTNRAAGDVAAHHGHFGADVTRSGDPGKGADVRSASNADRTSARIEHDVRLDDDVLRDQHLLIADDRRLRRLV